MPKFASSSGNYQRDHRDQSLLYLMLRRHSLRMTAQTYATLSFGGDGKSKSLCNPLYTPAAISPPRMGAIQ